MSLSRTPWSVIKVKMVACNRVQMHTSSHVSTLPFSTTRVGSLPAPLRPKVVDRLGEYARRDAETTRTQ